MHRIHAVHNTVIQVIQFYESRVHRIERRLYVFVDLHDVEPLQAIFGHVVDFLWGAVRFKELQRYENLFQILSVPEITIACIYKIIILHEVDCGVQVDCGVFDQSFYRESHLCESRGQ